VRPSALAAAPPVAPGNTIWKRRGRVAKGEIDKKDVLREQRLTGSSIHKRSRRWIIDYVRGLQDARSPEDCFNLQWDLLADVRKCQDVIKEFRGKRDKLKAEIRQVPKEPDALLTAWRLRKDGASSVTLAFVTRGSVAQTAGPIIWPILRHG